MKTLLIILLGIVAGSAHAAAVTYDFTIVGDVTLGDECLGPNSFNLTGGCGFGSLDTITATGTFTADLGTVGNETGTVSFGLLSGNTLSIDMDGAGTLTEADDTGGTGASLSFLNGQLTDFDFLTDDGDSLSSLFLDFTNGANGGAGQYVGEWRPDVTLTAVPVPAAIWLFGSALGLFGSVRRRITR